MVHTEDTVFALLMLFWFDVFYAVFVAAVVIAVRKAIKKVEKTSFLLILGIYTLVFVLLCSVSFGNYYLAKYRAGKLIVACENYKQKYGEYPDELTDIVPEFIDSIPSAKYTLLGPVQFYYRKSSMSGKHILGYNVIVFLCDDYYFEDKEWICRD